jgi:hypothetical protein
MFSNLSFDKGRGVCRGVCGVWKVLATLVDSRSIVGLEEGVPAQVNNLED